MRHHRLEMTELLISSKAELRNKWVILSPETVARRLNLGIKKSYYLQMFPACKTSQLLCCCADGTHVQQTETYASP